MTEKEARKQLYLLGRQLYPDEPAYMIWQKVKEAISHFIYNVGIPF